MCKTNENNVEQALEEKWKNATISKCVKLSLDEVLELQSETHYWMCISDEVTRQETGKGVETELFL